MQSGNPDMQQHQYLALCNLVYLVHEREFLGYQTKSWLAVSALKALLGAEGAHGLFLRPAWHGILAKHSLGGVSLGTVPQLGFLQCLI